MRKLARTLCVLTTLLVSACVSIEQSPSQQYLGEHKVSEKSYTLGQEMEAVVGGDIVKVKDYSVSEIASNQVEVTSDFQFNHAMFSKTFHKGEFYPYSGRATYDNQQFNMMKVGSFGILFDDNGAVYHKIINGLDPVGGYPAIPVAMIYTFDAQPPGSHLHRVVNQTANKNASGQNFEIIFTGITSDSIRMSYREYTPDDLARSAYSQDLTYPLKSKQIRFRNLLVDVIDVTPEHIKYRVISDQSS